MKNLTLILSFVVIAFGLSVQNADQFVISTSGGQMKSGQYSLNRTLGEPEISTYQNQNLILTQGFHQPMEVVTDINTQNENEILVYPNPTIDLLHFELPSKLSKVDIRVYNLHGRQISGYSKISMDQSISLEDLASGTYIIPILNLRTKK